MLEFRQRWSSVATSGGQAAIKVTGDVLQSAWYFTASTGESTATGIVQSAESSGGPWYDEAASTELSSGITVVLRVPGPFEWVRPWCGSTGITVRAIGVR